MIALAFHEYTHAFVANWYGDDTAKQSGRLTLNLLQLRFGTLYPFYKYNMLSVICDADTGYGNPIKWLRVD